MYSVSNDYRTKMFDDVQTHKLSGTINQSFTFTDKDVIGVSYSNQCSDKKVSIGSVNIGVLKLTFLKDILNRGDYYGKKITLSDYLLLGYDQNNDPIWEPVPIGVFYIGDAVHTGQDMVDITAYDCLSKMDIELDIGQTSGKLFDFCRAIQTATGATFGLTQAECELLPNGNKVIGPYPDNDMSTYRDLLSKLAQIVGGFAYADRDGTWKLRTFDNDPVLSVPKNRRFSGAKFSDFQTRFDCLSYEDVRVTGETKYIGDTTGFIMDLGNNPFLQYGTTTYIYEMVTAIFNRVSLMTYTPFKVSMLPAFVALDLGDVISFTSDYTSDTSSGAVMKVTWVYNKSLMVECFGSNPNLRSGQSSTDHALRGASSANREGRIATFTGKNITELTVDSNKTEILSALFSTSSTQPLLTLTEVKFNLSEAGTVEVFYELDGVEILYSPEETYSEAGIHTISLMYPVQVEEINTRHRFKVKMRTSSGLTIEPENARIYIQGTGYDMTGGFDGIIEANDEFTDISFGYMEPIALIDSASVTFYQNIGVEASDQIGDYAFATLQMESVTESVNIYMMSGFNRVTEDGIQRVTEDGYRRITE